MGTSGRLFWHNEIQQVILNCKTSLCTSTYSLSRSHRFLYLYVIELAKLRKKGEKKKYSEPVHNHLSVLPEGIF